MKKHLFYFFSISLYFAISCVYSMDYTFYHNQLLNFKELDLNQPAPGEIEDAIDNNYIRNINDINLNVESEGDYTTDEENNTLTTKPVIPVQDIVLLAEFFNENRNSTEKMQIQYINNDLNTKIEKFPKKTSTFKDLIKEAYKIYSPLNEEFSEKPMKKRKNKQDNKIHLPLTGKEMHYIISISNSNNLSLEQVYDLYHNSLVKKKFK